MATIYKCNNLDCKFNGFYHGHKGCEADEITLDCSGDCISFEDVGADGFVEDSDEV